MCAHDNERFVLQSIIGTAVRKLIPRDQSCGGRLTG